MLVALALVPAIAAAIGEPYYVTLFTRILIFALAAVGLNLILGYGGLVSFGHAMYIGIGAYAVGILSHYGIANGWVQLAAALGVGAVVAVVIGLVCLRTSGMAFIMITLAFAQMLYFLAISLKTVRRRRRAHDRRAQRLRPVLAASNVALYYCAFVVLVASLLGARAARSLALRHGDPRRRAATSGAWPRWASRCCATSSRRT